jgi:hypothetical protein
MMGYLEALAGIALSLSLLMTIAWLVQQRTGNSGWVDTIWTFSVGLTGAGSALWPIGGAAPNPRQWLVAALVALWALRLGSHIALRSANISDDPRYAAFAREWGVDAPRRMFVFLQNQGFWIDPAGLLDLRRRAVSARGTAPAGLSGRIDPACGYRRRSPGRCAAEKFPKQFRQQGRSLRRRAVALVAPSELFLRMVRLARLSRRWKSRCCASGASAIATISRAPAPSFRCQRPAPPTPKVTIGRRFTVSPERLTEIVLYLGLE